MKTLDAIMESPFVYRLWIQPFAEQKFAPLLLSNDVHRAQRVLDVGCGPGTNARHFAHANYLGIDCNQRYIRSARTRNHGSFIVADAANLTVPSGQRFDFILVNSLLHHLDAKLVQKLLANLVGLLAEDGHVHILELALPPHASIASLLAYCDRGKFARPAEEWQRMFCDAFEQVRFDAYRVSACGLALWNMVYFKGRAKA
jgi:SAM-dependent methyltransferase